MKPLPLSSAQRATSSYLVTAMVLLLALMSAAFESRAGDGKADGKLGTETRNVSDFDAIAVKGPFNVVVRQAAKESVTVTADARLLPMIETVVEASGSGRSLVIRLRQGESSKWRGEIKVLVDVVKLNAVSSAGAGDITVDGLKTASLKAAIAGSGDLRFKSLTADALEVRIAGSGDVQAQGSARQLKLSIAGSGDAAMTELVADDVTVSIAGSGDAQVTANKSLHATVAGSGDVQYRGSATDVHTSAMGSGTIRRK